ncbi:DUF3089 domain-containing protein [Novosphingobium bradum]|uniref:DUF3089 domain-containing protein n=1 Tax=Novosphingobium bradum TaxID=1737444 RepID=A0ABV7IRN3_9SPHN
MARKFLYAMAVLIALVFAGRLALTFYGANLMGLALVPRHGFEARPPLAPTAYADPALWLSRPGLAQDPARLRPAGLATSEAPLPAAVFFIHPTSYMSAAHWNAPAGANQADSQESDRLARMLVRAMASAFNASPDLWAPRYRQATFGAFLADRPERTAALDLAYGDVRQAFHAFLAAIAPGQPIVLVGDSQGALHLKRLLRDEVAGKPLARRIAAAYVVGWPVSLAHDLPAMGLPACTAPAQSRCVMSWLSYAEPADPKLTLAAYGRFPALDGKLPGGSPFLCSNPLTGGTSGMAPASRNRGTLVPDAAMEGGKLVPGMVPARCAPDGFLLIGPPPDMGQYVLPGNNYHVYDMLLFWANLRADAAARVAAWKPAA